MDWAIGVALVLAAYLLGSIPSGYIVVRQSRGVDIREVGSRNVGALNAFHEAGLRGGGLVLAADMAKGAAAALLPALPGAPPWLLYFSAIAVVAGHNWPVFLGFRGGKGVAAIMGVSLVVAPLPTLIATLPGLLVLLLSRNAVLGTGVGFIALDALLIAGGSQPGIAALLLFLTGLATATYLVGAWGQISTAIRTRQWRGLFYGTNMNP